MKTFVVKTSYNYQLLSCYVFAQESIAPLICSVAMSLYDITSNSTLILMMNVLLHTRRGRSVSLSVHVFICMHVCIYVYACTVYVRVCESTSETLHSQCQSRQ